ncbi:unnamed protein product [Closterium sp. Naga37s-1]|nr:unnamed protein product [Closterium sp. Naga37s-1]
MTLVVPCLPFHTPMLLFDLLPRPMCYVSHGTRPASFSLLCDLSAALFRDSTNSPSSSPSLPLSTSPAPPPTTDAALLAASCAAHESLLPPSSAPSPLSYAPSCPPPPLPPWPHHPCNPHLHPCRSPPPLLYASP